MTDHPTLDSKLKQRALHRAKIIGGQINGLLKALENETYCVDLLRQSLSIRKSLESLDALMLENHLKSHVTAQLTTAEQRPRAIAELVELYLLANK